MQTARLASLIVALLLAANARAEEVPQGIVAPGGHKRVASVRAKGVQVYKAVEGKSGGLEWVLEGPLADLTDDKGGKAGCHYDGPAWEAVDGSKVIRDVGEAVKSVPAPDPKADIPWLLVKVKAADGKAGAFAGVVYVQRVATSGGKAPAALPVRAGTKIGVAYTATYHLWAKAD